MKKSRILGYALTLAATLMVGSAMGQYVGTKYPNYVQINEGTPGDAQEFSLVEVGTKFGFFAKPDAAYHPNYDVDGSLTKDFIWTWSITPATVTPVAAATQTKTTAGGTDDANYVEATFTENKEYTIIATEKAPAVWNITCTNPRTFKVYAFPTPSFSAVTTSPTEPICTSVDVRKDAVFTINSSGTPHVQYVIERRVATFDPTSGIQWPVAATSKVVDKSTVAAAENFGTTWLWNQTASTPPATALATDGNRITMTDALVIGATPTLAKYKFEISQNLAKPDIASNERAVKYTFKVIGVNGLISRKADLSAGTPDSFYGTVASVDYILVAAPTTGPVYHINNNVAK